MTAGKKAPGGQEYLAAGQFFFNKIVYQNPPHYLTLHSSRYNIVL